MRYRAIVVLLSLMCVGVLWGATATTQPKVKAARAEYDAAVERAKQEFDAKVAEAQKKYVAVLEPAMIEATKAGNLDEALGIRNEKRKMEEALSGTVYLATLKETADAAIFEKNSGKQVNEEVAPHSLYAHPFANGSSRLTYDLGGKFQTFKTGAAIDDEAANKTATDLTFRVVGDGKELWQSKPVHSINEVQDCEVDVKGVKTLELIVDCPGSDVWAHAMWLSPRVK